MSELKLSPHTYVEVFGRISKIFQKQSNRLAFQILAYQSNRLINCCCPYFLDIVEGDVIFMKGFVDEAGKNLAPSHLPFVSTPTDEDSTIESLAIALNRKGSLGLVTRAFKKFLVKDQPLADRLDLMAIWYHHHSQACLESLLKGGSSNPLFGYREDFKQVLSWWYRRRCLRRLHLLGLTNQQIKASGLDAYQLYHQLLKNPYAVVSISLDQADQLLQRLNKPPESVNRRRGEISRYLQKLLDKKMVYQTTEKLQEEFPDLSEHREALIKEYGLRFDNQRVCLNYYYQLERKTAALIKQHLQKSPKCYLEEVENFLATSSTKPQLNQEQREAVIGALTNPVSIITGPAGSGKTTLLQVLVNFLVARDHRLMITSFTGKAVGRVKEVIKLPSKAKKTPVDQVIMTMHRYIYRHDQEIDRYDHIIIDETSMVETAVFYQFIQKINPDCRITFVGDINQLPPIGWGCLFHQIISSHQLPVFYLKANHRCQDGVVVNANRILDGQFFKPNDSFKLCFGQSVMQVIETEGFSLPEEVKVLTPFRRRADEINQLMQSYYNSGQVPLIDEKGRQWCRSDRVMMTQNNYHHHLMNGQEGYVADFLPNHRGLKVVFEGQPYHFYFRPDNFNQLIALYPPSSRKYLDLDEACEVTLTQANRKPFVNKKLRLVSRDQVLIGQIKDEIESRQEEGNYQYPPVDHLIHAYALTIHKAQGSEWPHVIVDLTSSSDFITRNLLYTAITRARQKIYLTGRPEAWKKGVARTEEEPQQYLATCLKESC